MNSKFFRLHIQDIGKGLLTSILGGVAGYGLTAIQTGALFPIDWNTVGIVALGAGLAYLKKNLLTNSDGKFAKKEVK